MKISYKITRSFRFGNLLFMAPRASTPPIYFPGVFVNVPYGINNKQLKESGVKIIRVIFHLFISLSRD